MRKTKEIRITAGTAETNRDFGKVFVLTEMSAFTAERWAADALHGLAQSGVEVPDDVASRGIMAVASFGLKALGGMPSPTFHDLMDRLMACVVYYPDPAHREVSRPVTGLPPFENDVEEIATLVKLRSEVFTLCTGFSLAGVQSLAASTTAPAQT